jgi:TATA-box binding protein (TBP) (component of TFIID and TFIIIB)
LIGYELYISKLPKENAEQEYSNICKLYKFYHLIFNKMSKMNDNSISDIKEKIKELVHLIKDIQIKVRNSIESDLKNIISVNNHSSLMNFLTTEYRNKQ